MKKGRKRGAGVHQNLPGASTPLMVLKVLRLIRSGSSQASSGVDDRRCADVYFGGWSRERLIAIERRFAAAIARATAVSPAGGLCTREGHHLSGPAPDAPIRG